MASFLFAYPARTHRRERLAELFWPELDAERSRAAFNSAIWRLRKVIGKEPASCGGANLRTLGTDVILEPQSWLEVDIHVFESNVQQLFRHAGSLQDSSFRTALSRAIDYYEGPFLDGEDTDWVLEERERFHSLFVRAAMGLVRYYGQSGAYEDGIALARRILSFDPYRESVIRSLLALLSLNDQRCDALKFYDRWKASLRQELAVEPMPATIETVRELRACQSFHEFESFACRVFVDRRVPGSQIT